LRAKKKSWGELKQQWTPHDTRDQVVDFVKDWSAKTELPLQRLVSWIGIARGKYYDWQQRFGKVNEHNADVPRDHWLTPDEVDNICRFARQHPTEGYRRLSFLMLDDNVVAASPSSVYRVLKKYDLLAGSSPLPSKKGTGFVQPLRPHEHWHIDVSYLNICGTFYFLCSVLDGCSRFLVHHEIREKMEEKDVEIILQRAREKFPGETPRIISDNGPQFIAKDFKEFIRICRMTHVKTSPYYPQSNGKIERWHKTIKGDCVRKQVPLSIEDARRLIAMFIEDYNERRLHGAIGYVTPRDRLENRHEMIYAERDRKLAEARERRAEMRRRQREHTLPIKIAAKPALPIEKQIDFACLKTTIKIADVLNLLGFRPATQHGSQQRGACPLHGAKLGLAKCFSVNVDRDVFHCFKCGRSGNALDLWCAATKQTPYDAALDLCQRLHRAVPYLTLTQNREEEPVSSSG